MKIKDRKTIIPWLILLALMLTWGSSFILIKRGLEVYSNVEVGALRICITFIIFIPFIKRFSKVKANQWKYLVIVGIVGSGAPSFLFAKAQTGIDSNLAGILNSLTPLFTLIISISLFRVKSRLINILGVIVGLVGAAGLLYVSGDKGFEFNLSFAIYVIIASICYAISVNVVKNFLQDIDSLTITAFSFLIIGLPVLIYLLFLTEFTTQLLNNDRALEGLGYIIILAIIGTGLALIVFNYLVKITNAVFASSVTYLIPIVAIIWGIIDGEKFKLIYLLWITLILFGVFLVNKKRRKKQEDA
ncbi:MAG: DMT family transporter [Bacteroidales bacterium]|nr:DMT family transporter [Bacteroidales bacterium]